VGSLYSLTGRPEEALNYLKRVTYACPYDVDAWIELAEILADKDDKDAKQAYQTAVILFRSASEEGKAPKELCNNLAVVMHRRGEYEPALEMYSEAVDGLPKEDEDQTKLFQADSVSVTYNIARLHEEMGAIAKAVALYNGILQQHPHYTDCYLRLTALAAQSNDLTVAFKHLNEAQRMDPTKASTLVTFGNLHLRADEFGPAQKRYEQGLGLDKYDQYSLISLGNVFLHSYRPESENCDVFLNRAFDYYSRVLRRAPNNIYAAQGIACTLAEKGRFEQAKEVFDLVREGTTESSDTLVNLAHCYLQAGQHAQAVNTYQKCLQKFHCNSNLTILHFIAVAHYDAREFEECVKALQKASFIAPQDHIIRFNTAVAKYKCARKILEDGDADLAQCEAAKSHLHGAVRILIHMKDIAKKAESDESTKKHKQPFSSKRSDYWLEKSNKSLEHVTPKVQEIKDIIQAKEKARQLQRQIFEDTMRKRAAAEKEKKDAQLAKLQEMEEIAKQKEERLQQSIAEWKAADDSALVSATQDQEKRAKKKKKGDLEVVDEEEFPAPPSPSPERNPAEDDDADDDDDAGSAAREKDAGEQDDAPKKKKLRRMRNSDSDDSSDADEKEADKEDNKQDAGDEAEPKAAEEAEKEEAPQDPVESGASPAAEEAPSEDAPQTASEPQDEADGDGAKKRKRGIVMDDSDDDE